MISSFQKSAGNTKAASTKTANSKAALAFVLVCSVLGFTGCSVIKPVVAPPDKSKDALETVINRAATEKPETASSDTQVKPALMTGAALSVDFAGDAKTLVRQLAAARGLTYTVTGPEPRLPLFVVVNSKNVDFTSLMRDIGGQFGQRADIVLSPKNVEIRYR